MRRDLRVIQAVRSHEVTLYPCSSVDDASIAALYSCDHPTLYASTSSRLAPRPVRRRNLCFHTNIPWIERVAQALPR
ncbi:hypothetical protein BD309DRAFT_994770 [Dichomitus squalens]|uniref:Uncharacterized protein n=2 Tax=Dichomitus squalens TaxID=114155 RepID=A0A4Q9PJY1_9APHY|nr:uncharacterized protein DICSQDRAFT_137511 [Dichomitus squalens LYAD-421 SS1]EJF60422.1 hypothetical protein DICSQDRAFT_137511 [Dichomitus squalens LYAD-421 SS1]TBU26501.1 hypothetical protein BD311DRAFT_779623 [Dichomitus squalens]TBU37944.1 hypothetical protein BD309DRAFT_994770 [Dichomitus squalens]TBU54404.1 hypothetical protein BD310DRAFT_951454 [Dichomitus squalens]